ncbi:MAG: hypothetical protein KGK44_00505 [Gammaproteobacteria bacterium]|nr:hypothetical protein [Gammaproteobacteria bacterium]
MRKSKKQKSTHVDTELAHLVKSMQSKTARKASRSVSKATPDELADAARKYRLNEKAMYQLQELQAIASKHKGKHNTSIVDELINERRRDAKSE